MVLVRKLISVLVTASLVFGLVGTALALTPADIGTAAQRMHELGLVNGKDPANPNNLQLDQPITRAELMTIMVRAWGQSESADILKGATAFPDTPRHWASGYIAVAKAIIVERNRSSMGMPDGTFAPDGKVTAGQAVAFLMKFLGIQPDPIKQWPDNYLDAAVAARMIPAAVRDSIRSTANNEATRGLVFLLADTAFSTYELTPGKTAYTTYVRPGLPVLSVEASQSTTTAAKVTISGSVSPDAKTVYVGSPTNLVQIKNGKFSTEYSLSLGANEVTVGAANIVGGTTIRKVTVTRNEEVAARINAPASITVKAGESVPLTGISVVSASGSVMPNAQVTVTSNLGTYAGGTFTAGTRAGSGTATVSHGDLKVTIAVTVQPSEMAGITINPPSAEIASGNSQKFVATGTDRYGNVTTQATAFTWSASKGIIGADGTFGATDDATGTITITASAGSVRGNATVVVFGAPAKVQIAAPSPLAADGVSTVDVTATVLDAGGNVAKNYSGTVTFGSTNSTVAKVQTATVAAINGIATTTLVAGTRVGTTALTATGPNLSASTVMYTTTTQQLASFALEAVPDTINARSSSRGSLKITALDQNGHQLKSLPSGTFRMRIASDDTDYVTISGQRSQEVTLTGVVTTLDIVRGTTKVGSATLTAEVTAPSGYTTTEVNSVTVNTILVGEPDGVAIDDVDDAVAGKTSTVTFRVVDYSGNQITTSVADDLDYTVSIKRGGTSLTSAQVQAMISGSQEPIRYGAGTFTIDWSEAPHSTGRGSAGDYTVTVRAGSLDSGSRTLTVAPGEAYALGIAANPETLSANGSATSLLTVKIYDRYDNVVTDGSYDVTITRSSGSDRVTDASAEKTVTTENGMATVVLTSGTGIGVDTFTATSAGFAPATASVRVAILGAAYQLALIDAAGRHSTRTLSFSAIQATAGDTFELEVAVEDANGTTLTHDQGTPVTVEIFSGSTSLGSWTGSTQYGIASIPVRLTKATSTGFKVVATSGSRRKASVERAVKVLPGDATGLNVSADHETIAATSGGVPSQATITVQLVDQYGNLAADDTTVYAVESTLNYGELIGSREDSSSDYSGYVAVPVRDGRGSVVFESSSRAGSVTIIVEAPNLGEETVVLQTAIVGDADGLVVSRIQDTPVDNVNVTASTTYQEITVSLVDGAGRIRTQDDGKKITINKSELLTPERTGHLGIYVADTSGHMVAYNGSNALTENGSVTFYVVSEVAGRLDYTFRYQTAGVGTSTSTDDRFLTASAVGEFLPGEADHVQVLDADPFTISGDGHDSTIVTAEVVDEFGNVVTTVDSGEMQFEIKYGSDYGTLEESRASVIEGQAVVLAWSRRVTSDGTVRIRAGYDLNGDGAISEEEYSELHTAFEVVAP